MEIQITVKPTFAQLAKAFDSVDATNILRDELYKIAFRIERNAKQLTPVDTGRLRASIATSMYIGSLGAKVSTYVDYAVYVHEGTRYMRARPFMEKGAEMAKGMIEGDLVKRIDAEFAKAFKKI